MKMNKIILLLFASVTLIPATLDAQTAGTLTFNFTTASTGGYSPKHLVAVWIENSSTAFVKTKLKRSSNGNLDHLNLWTAKSGNNVADAVTGATLTAHSPLTVSWNGSGVNGSQVPDGNYTVWVEMAWASNMMTGKTSQSFTFSKGRNSVHLTPASTTNLSNISLDWVPTVSSTEEVPVENNIKVYPNPTTGIINIEFDQSIGKSVIRVMNLLGSVVYQENSSDEGPLTKTIDLSNLTKGIYFIRIENSGINRSFKIILN